MKRRNYDTYENLDVRGRPSGPSPVWTARNIEHQETFEITKLMKP